MTDDLASAYSSIYDKKEEGKEQLNELPIVPIIKGAMVAKNVIDGVNKIRGKGQKHPDNQTEDVALTHLDGSTTEIIDVVKPEPLADLSLIHI